MMASRKKAARERNVAATPAPFSLKNFRESKKISLEEIAERTKISVRFLQAIEGGEYAKLPGGIFDINYLRQYAAAIGYSDEVLLEHYRRQTGHSGEPAPEPRKGGIFSRWFDLAAHGRS